MTTETTHGADLPEVEIPTPEAVLERVAKEVRQIRRELGEADWTAENEETKETMRLTFEDAIDVLVKNERRTDDNVKTLFERTKQLRKVFKKRDKQLAKRFKKLQTILLMLNKLTSSNHKCLHHLRMILQREGLWKPELDEGMSDEKLEEMMKEFGDGTTGERSDQEQERGD